MKPTELNEIEINGVAYVKKNGLTWWQAVKNKKNTEKKPNGYCLDCGESSMILLGFGMATIAMRLYVLLNSTDGK